MTARDQIIAAINADCPNIKYVAGIADATAILNGTVALNHAPAAFVFRMRHTASAKQYPTDDFQALDVRFGILLFLRHAGDTGSGELISNQVDELLPEVHKAVRGLKPVVADQEHSKFVLQGGALVQWEKDRLVWQEEITTRMVQR